jgi:hypothetical protein
VAVTLHRCSNVWVKLGAHPCWKIEQALQDMGIEYERAPGPLRRGKREEMAQHTGQRLYPAIEFEDGSWYHEESTEMEKTIRAGKLMEHAKGAPAPITG